MKKIKVFGMTIGPLALLVGCGTIVLDEQTGGCIDYTPLEDSCPAGYYTMDGGQCVLAYFKAVPGGADPFTECIKQTIPASSPIKCQGDAGAPSASSGIGPSPLAFIKRLQPHATAIAYPANQMQAFLATPTGSAPFDLKATVLICLSSRFFQAHRRFSPGWRIAIRLKPY